MTATIAITIDESGGTGSVGPGSSAEEPGVGAQAGRQRYHEHPEEALHQALQPQAIRPIPQPV